MSNEHHPGVHQIAQFDVRRFQRSQVLAGNTDVQIAWLDARESSQIVDNLERWFHTVKLDMKITTHDLESDRPADHEVAEQWFLSNIILQSFEKSTRYSNFAFFSLLCVKVFIKFLCIQIIRIPNRYHIISNGKLTKEKHL